MLSTNLRFTQTLDPTGVTRPRYPFATARTTAGSIVIDVTVAAATVNPSASGEWSSNDGCKTMPTFDLHPDRWPPHSPS